MTARVTRRRTIDLIMRCRSNRRRVTNMMEIPPASPSRPPPESRDTPRTKDRSSVGRRSPCLRFSGVQMTAITRISAQNSPIAHEICRSTPVISTFSVKSLGLLESQVISTPLNRTDPPRHPENLGTEYDQYLGWGELTFQKVHPLLKETIRLHSVFTYAERALLIRLAGVRPHRRSQ